MILVGITLFLILIGLGFFVYGAIGLSKYAFRLGTGQGLAVLLFPPYTIYFALFKLEEDGKSWPTASWLFGLVVAALLSAAFWPDLSALMRGDMERFEGPIGAGAAAVEEYGNKELPEDSSDEKSDDDKTEEADEEKAESAEEGAEAEGEGEKAAAKEGEGGEEAGAAKDGEAEEGADKEESAEASK